MFDAFQKTTPACCVLRVPWKRPGGGVSRVPCSRGGDRVILVAKGGCRTCISGGSQKMWKDENRPITWQYSFGFEQSNDPDISYPPRNRPRPVGVKCSSKVVVEGRRRRPHFPHLPQSFALVLSIAVAYLYSNITSSHSSILHFRSANSDDCRE